MSDIKPERDSFDAAGVVPHSGHLGFEQPVQEFDNTTLYQAHEQGLITIPENPSALVEAPKPKGRVLAFVGGLAAAGAGAVAFLTMSSGGETATVPTAPTEQEPVNTPEATPQTVETPVPTTVDIVIPELEQAPQAEPVLMTATTPEGLLEQFVHNYNCMLKDNPPETQNACLEHLIGQEFGPVPDYYLGLIPAMNRYRDAEPSFEYSFEAEYLRTEYMDSNMVIIDAVLTDHNGSVERRLTFTKTSIDDITLAGESTESSVWIIVGQQ